LTTIRAATLEDIPAIVSLHKHVSATSGGLARFPDEITVEYVTGVVTRSLADGVIVVAEAPDISGLAGELHTYRNPLRLFHHVYTNLTIAVHPECQGRGLGRALFRSLLETVRLERPDVLRVELISAESNARAHLLYQAMGFVREGRLDRAICGANGVPEADIPMAWFRTPTPAS
jgi:ribosomal protein S18 acetylase RimI-like enzyme